MKKIIITKKYIIISILILIFILLKISQFSSIQRNFSSYNEKKFAAKCIKVIDGDTIDISFLNEIPNDCKKNERIRLIGINTPELDKNGIPEYFAKEAFYWTNGELLNQYIYIQYFTCFYTLENNSILLHARCKLRDLWRLVQQITTPTNSIVHQHPNKG